MNQIKRRRCFTSEAIATIRDMAAAGKSVDEIAEKIGTSKRSLTMRCYRLGIELPRDPTPIRKPRAKGKHKRELRQDDIVQVCIRMPVSFWQLLKRDARMQRRTLTAAVLRRLEQSIRADNRDSPMQLAMKEAVEVAVERLANETSSASCKANSAIQKSA